MSFPTWVGVTNQFPLSHYFQHFSNVNQRNSDYLLNITFIFNRCPHSWAVGTPVQYECDLENLTGTFAKFETFLIIESSFSDPHPKCLQKGQFDLLPYFSVRDNGLSTSEIQFQILPATYLCQNTVWLTGTALLLLWAFIIWNFVSQNT